MDIDRSHARWAKERHLSSVVVKHAKRFASESSAAVDHA